MLGINGSVGREQATARSLRRLEKVTLPRARTATQQLGGSPMIVCIISSNDKIPIVIVIPIYFLYVLVLVRVSTRAATSTGIFVSRLLRKPREFYKSLMARLNIANN
jgi:hypothetical protein